MLEIKGLTGGYVNIPVLKDISFTVRNGELVGLIGLNGAGKSTTINEIIGLLTPYKGKILIDGAKLQDSPTAYREKIGFIPETPSLYEELTLREHIETVAMAYDVEQKVAFARVEKLLTMFRLKEKLDWFPMHFSKGMKQKVMIICAFVVDPSLFIVDEPFLGLDPVAIADLIELLEDEKAKQEEAIDLEVHQLVDFTVQNKPYTIDVTGYDKFAPDVSLRFFDVPKQSTEDIVADYGAIKFSFLNEGKDLEVSFPNGVTETHHIYDLLKNGPKDDSQPFTIEGKGYKLNIYRYYAKDYGTRIITFSVLYK